MFRRHRHKTTTPETRESLERAQSDRAEQERKRAEEQDVNSALTRIQHENDVARLLRLVLGGR